MRHCDPHAKIIQRFSYNLVRKRCARERGTVNPRRIKGPWKNGYTLDEHTISSVPIGYDEYGHTLFDTKRSDIGELLYRLKYRGDRSQIAPLAKAAQGFI